MEGEIESVEKRGLLPRMVCLNLYLVFSPHLGLFYRTSVENRWLLPRFVCLLYPYNWSLLLHIRSLLPHWVSFDTFVCLRYALFSTIWNTPASTCNS